MGKDRFEAFLKSRGWSSFPFQRQTWRACEKGGSGLVNAPTGSGKTFSLVLPILHQYQEHSRAGLTGKSVFALWITPIRALASEIAESAREAAEYLGVEGDIVVRTGDIPAGERRKLFSRNTALLITTPESLHLILASKEYPGLLRELSYIVADEWHELLGTKRAVLMELAISRLVHHSGNLKVWGISATIGNLDQALEVLLGKHDSLLENTHLIRSTRRKSIQVRAMIPDTIETLPWAGHLGTRMAEPVVERIRKSRSTLIFTNTRAQTEIWYQKILEAAPDLAGQMAIHHGSLSNDIRSWVENALHEESLKAVVCTSSLDLGVDFRPVETIIQIGSPKGVARFMQRAGRSGHRPGETSRIYFVPTHSLELVESAALRQAVKNSYLEERQPYILSFDVLAQYLVTLAVSTGFKPDQIYKEVLHTFSFGQMELREWEWILHFLVRGGSSLDRYDEYKKVTFEQGLCRVRDRRTAMRHRMSIGTIVGDALLKVKYMNGTYIGSIEEWFISKLKPGDRFWFSGKSLELIRIREMTVQVRRTSDKQGKVPSWMGGRMPLSSNLSMMIRETLTRGRTGAFSNRQDPELAALRPVFQLQEELSRLPTENHFLMEYYPTREGHHYLMFPFEGRNVHEGMASVIAFRLSRVTPASFSIAMNDYGFEILSNHPFNPERLKDPELYTTRGLSADIQASVNFTEMARRKFRDIAVISGLVFRGFPDNRKMDRHLQASSQLLYEVFLNYEPDHLLLRQAFAEVFDFQLEEIRLREAFQRISRQEIILTRPTRFTPLAFPILVDRLREQMSTEKLEKRIEKMKLMKV